jgi:hypothetical protein
MRFVRQVFVSLVGALFVLGAFGVFQPTSVHAQEVEAGDPAAGFDDIVGTGPNGDNAVGLIFANICDSPAPPEGGADTCACRDTGQCDLDDVLQVFVNVTIFILGISGSVILLMFVYGGFLWITSRGDAKRIEKGKDTITHAVIGFAIIVLSYSMINFLIAALAGDAPGETIEETIENAADKNPDIDTSGD